MANKLTKLVLDKAPGNYYGDYPVSTASKPSKDEEMRRRRNCAEDALRTLVRAEEIRRDKQLMADVVVVAAEQAKNLKSVKRPGA